MRAAADSLAMSTPYTYEVYGVDPVDSMNCPVSDTSAWRGDIADDNIDTSCTTVPSDDRTQETCSSDFDDPLVGALLAIGGMAGAIAVGKPKSSGETTPTAARPAWQVPSAEPTPQPPTQPPAQPPAQPSYGGVPSGYQPQYGQPPSGPGQSGPGPS